MLYSIVFTRDPLEHEAPNDPQQNLRPSTSRKGTSLEPGHYHALMRFTGKKVVLRAFELADVESLAAWANDPVTQDGIGDIHFPSSLEFHKNWVINLADSPLNQRFAVEIPDGSIIGISSIMNIDWRSRRAWHGLVLGNASHRGQGYGVDAIMATMRYAFDELNLNRLDGAIIEYNTASLATYLGPKVGWSEEGRRRDYYFRKGRYWDQIVVGVTAKDYYALVERSQYWS